ncbi:hypothetical protein F8M41_015750 [Gigaspora margarita]|uniref:Uncharacterized protein n=1 Tax=Gigaspora margarita TaxID=4874 RepID=A0A8H4AQ59_GIGMA|nr:hypothetical protein F8M41_015750 [Gigaspora margarita]
MPLPSKGKRRSKNQYRSANGQFHTKINHTAIISTDQEDMVDEFDKLYNSDRQSESDVSDLEWGDEEDSRWDDTENTETEIKIYQKLKELKLV